MPHSLKDWITHFVPSFVILHYHATFLCPHKQRCDVLYVSHMHKVDSFSFKNTPVGPFKQRQTLH